MSEIDEINFVCVHAKPEQKSHRRFGSKMKNQYSSDENSSSVERKDKRSRNHRRRRKKSSLRRKFSESE